MNFYLAVVLIFAAFKLFELVDAQFLADLFNVQSNQIEKPRYFDEYDFVIIGSGPGGCVLANRLTENPNWNVLMIEAGKVETLLQRIPVMAAFMQSTDYNWGYTSEPQEGSCMGMVGQRCNLPRGKGLGGSSVINYMIYSRGHRNDYDRWAAAGNTGWSWAEVLPYFLKSEHATLNNMTNPRMHNRKGMLNVENNRFRTNTAKGFVKALKYMGQKEIDYNSGDEMGVAYLQATTSNGRRHSAYKAFIEPVLDRPNLHIMINTRVTKILIDPLSKTAYGAEFLRNGKIYHVTAKREVILSAGTFSSPQLLMLSGVGPERDLRKFNIPVIKDLPVGKIMNDHVSHLGPTFIVNSTGQSFKANRVYEIEHYFDYINGRGGLTVPGGVEALSFIKTKTKKDHGPNVPDVELIFVSGGFHSDEGTGIKRGMRMTDQIYNTVYKPLENEVSDTFTVMTMMFHPKSSGRLELKSKNPMKWPKIYENFFQHPDDIETMLEGIKYSIKLIDTPPMKKLGARLHSIPLPNCAHIPFNSDDYWRCSIRTLASTLHHQTGTCRMGPANDPMAIVSPELKVHGMNRLRVVDTSIIPESPTAHTNAMSIMIGEKAADMIKREWRRRQ